MQVVVKRSDLTMGPNENVQIATTFEDNVVVDPELMGPGHTVLRVPPSAVEWPAIPPLGLLPYRAPAPADMFPRLAKGWRDKAKTEAASSEANRRIDAAFPEYSQRNSIAEEIGFITQYGADVSKWPQAARQRKAEFDRCWNYVNAVRTKYTALANSALPADPSSDSNWPTKIGPYKPA